MITIKQNKETFILKVWWHLLYLTRFSIIQFEKPGISVLLQDCTNSSISLHLYTIYMCTLSCYSTLISNFPSLATFFSFTFHHFPWAPPPPTNTLIPEQTGFLNKTHVDNVTYSTLYHVNMVSIVTLSLPCVNQSHINVFTIIPFFILFFQEYFMILVCLLKQSYQSLKHCKTSAN